MDIDFVVLWVDGNDPKWLAEKHKYDLTETDDRNSINRFRDWNLMHYWFRAVEKYAPWVRKIHFVTWGHVPSFLNLNHPKLHVVKHDEIIPVECLPTFSASAIELNINKIEGLSEHFVYLNDDTFIIKPMQPTDFFINDLPCAYFAETPVGFIGNVYMWDYLKVNDLSIVNAHFPKQYLRKKYPNKFFNSKYSMKDNLRTWVLSHFCKNFYTGFKDFHAPNAFLKTTLNDVWEMEYDKLFRTCKNKFRSPTDVNQWVFLWWQIASGRFTPGHCDNESIGICSETISEIEILIKTQKTKMICLNDPDSFVDFETLSKRVQDAFDTIFPEKCSFEK